MTLGKNLSPHIGQGTSLISLTVLLILPRDFLAAEERGLHTSTSSSSSTLLELEFLELVMFILAGLLSWVNFLEFPGVLVPGERSSMIIKPGLSDNFRFLLGE